MSLDTKHRPTGWDDVLGQAATKKVLRRFVASGAGFRQSYLFAGPYGSGKTTVGRILARALLCSNPSPQGDPCDCCDSCRSLLDLGTSLNFTEVDAATNSGVEAMRKITEEIQYATFGGNRRIYLFDESHQLSPSALDAMLKPLEESTPGTEDKKMVCIFCTTEPEKMKATILSRCAPAFVIQPVPPEEIAQRLARICEQEKIEYESPMLQLIAEATECHIRDALKAIEGVSMLGSINEVNVRTYLHLDLNSLYLDILDNMGTDLQVVTGSLRRILERTSPVTCYERLVEVCMMAYQSFLDTAKPASFWDAGRLKAIGQKHGDNLLGFAARLASRPGRPNASMLLCDLGHLHHVGGSVFGEQPVLASSIRMQSDCAPIKTLNPPQIIQDQVKTTETFNVKSTENSGNLKNVDTASVQDGVYVQSLAVGKVGGKTSGVSLGPKPISLELAPSEFCHLLGLRVAELDGDRGGQSRCSDMDRS